MNPVKKALSKFNSLPLTFRASFVYLCVSIVQKGLSFLTTPIFTRLMTSAEFGTVSVFFSLEQLIGTVAMFCLSAGCFDIGMQEYKNDRDTFCFSLLVLSNLVTVVTGIVLFALYPVAKNLLGISMPLLGIMFVVFIFQPAFTFWTRRERFEYHYKMPGILTVISAILASGIAVICIIFLPENRIAARILGQLIPLIILYIAFWAYIGKKANFRINRDYIKFAFWFNLPLIPHYLSSYILNSSDRLMINGMVGPSQAGYYSLAYSVSALVTVVWTAINSSLVPYVLEKYEHKQYKEVSDVVLPILTFFAAICLAIILVAPEIVGVLGTREYKESMYVIPPVIGGVFFQSLYYVFTNVLYYLKKPRIVMYASLSSAALNLLLNYIFIKKFGYIAAGYTTLACFALQASVDYIVVKKIMKQDIYDRKYLLLLTISVLVISLLSNALYSFSIIRYVVLAAIIIILWIKRDIVFNLMKKKKTNN